MRYLILLICLAIASAQNSTVLFLPDIKVENGKILMNINIEGGMEENGIIYNGTLVYGRYPQPKMIRNKRITNVATFCTNSNMGGGCFTMTDAQLNIYNLATIGYANSISSLQVLDLDCTVHGWTQINGQGTCWAFRSPVQVYNLDDYGLNDDFESITISCNQNFVRGLIVYENGNYQGRSSYVTGLITPNYSSYSTITNTGTCGSIRNDKASSLILLSYTSTVLYADINLSGTPTSYSNNAANIIYSAVSPNDQASSLTVQYSQ